MKRHYEPALAFDVTRDISEEICHKSQEEPYKWSDGMPRSEKPVSGLREEVTEWKAELPERINVNLGPGGRVVIPAVYRKAMGVNEGDRLMAKVVEGELRLITPEMAIRRAQEWVRQTIPPGESLVDTLMEMRRQEYEDEVSGG